jgi:hypothetical protein
MTGSTLERRYPDPLPAVHPVPEYRAEGELARRYEEVKSVLQVPWMGVVTMAFAHYPTFFGALWAGLRPLCASVPFVEAMKELRRGVEEEVAVLAPPPLAGRLHGIGYADREIDDIRATIEVFSHGNQPYVAIATAARLLLEGGEMRGGGEVLPFAGRHAPVASVPFVLMEAHHADPATRALYEDLKRVLRLPVVNTDYRALARWPSYFALAWGDLRAHPGTARHEAICRKFHDRAAELVGAGLPNPGGLDGAVLRRAAERDAPPGEVLQVVRLFQWLLPGLITNIAFLRAQLAP